MRRAVAIQMIINKELGLNFNENPWQGSFIVDELTDLVEEAVYKEFDALSERGGVLGARRPGRWSAGAPRGRRADDAWPPRAPLGRGCA